MSDTLVDVIIFAEISEMLWEKNRQEKNLSLPGLRKILPRKILLDGISLMSTKFLLYFHEKEMLKEGRLREKFWKRKLDRNIVA